MILQVELISKDYHTVSWSYLDIFRDGMGHFNSV